MLNRLAFRSIRIEMEVVSKLEEVSKVGKFSRTQASQETTTTIKKLKLDK